jgi:membrane-associated phospholipid phosphatase
MTDVRHPSSEVPAPVPRRLALRRLTRAHGVYGIALLAFAGLAVLAHRTAFFGWDLSIESGLQHLANPCLTAILMAISLPGNFATPYILTAVTVLAFWFFGLRSESMGLLISAGSAGLINRLFKLLIDRPRPTARLVHLLPADRNGPSFPSGHVAFYVGFFGFLFFVAYALLPRGSLVRRLALVVTAFPVLTVAVSRIYLGAHWPSDTLGGYLWSGVWLAIALGLYRHWKAKATFHRKPTAAGPTPKPHGGVN